MSERAGTARRVAIVCQLDRYANGMKPVEIERFLRARGHQPFLVNTYYLSRASSTPGSLRSKLPGRGVRRIALYANEALKVLIDRWGFGRRRLSYHLLLVDHRLRRSILASSLPLDTLDLVICETPHDAGILLAAGPARTLYDCPTPWADELYFEGRLTDRQHARLRRLESRIFEGVDHLAFWWQSYARHAVAHYGISGRNLMRLDYGCTPSPERAAFRDPPRIVYMGSLSSEFIDLPLLARLSRIYPNIDVYGAPEPDPAHGLNYRGYASPDILREYQAGLITCTKDELRRNGFSAKHPQYLAYGLPVLVPAWRRHLELLKGSVPYEEHDFAAVVAGLGRAEDWQRISDEAYAESQRLTWDRTLSPLADLLREPAG